jgi:HSP20 family molecular chaperone IbpA
MDIKAADNNEVMATLPLQVPGLNKEYIKVGIRNDRLIISGETPSARGECSGGESYVKFERSLPLPHDTKVSILAIDEI